MSDPDYEDIFLEDRLFPWLADDSMADECQELTFDPILGPDEPESYCDACDAALSDEQAEGESCPYCGEEFTDGDADSVAMVPPV